MYAGPAIGLWNSPNPFSETPGGTLRVADNVIFAFPGVLKSRRGWSQLSSSSFGVSSSRADSFNFYGSNILLNHSVSAVALFNGSSFSDFALTLSRVADTNRMRFIGAARSMFFNTYQGLYVWDGVGVAGKPILAGSNPVSYLTPTTSYNANGWMAPDSAVAYRATICYKDAFGRVVEGPPSDRIIFTNGLQLLLGAENYNGGNVYMQFFNDHNGYSELDAALISIYSGILQVGGPSEKPNLLQGKYAVTASGTDEWRYSFSGSDTQTSLFDKVVGVDINVAIRVGLPYGLTTSHFIRVYRSVSTVAMTDTPSDNLFLAYESDFLTSGNLSAGYIDFTDDTPDEFLDFPLYTNADATQTRFRMPQALDIVYWAERMWAANIRYQEFLYETLLGVGSPDGIQVGDVVTVWQGSTAIVVAQMTGVTGGTETTANQFGVYASGDPGDNIDRTARSIVKSINANSSNTGLIRASYAASEDAAPGKILLQSNFYGSTGDDRIAFGCTRQGAWSPKAQLSSGTQFIPSDAFQPAGLAWSALGLPEAFPPLNYININSPNFPILKIQPLNYRLIIFKGDGIYSCTNVEPFSISRMSEHVLIAPDSICVLEDKLYCLTTQGIMAISDSGQVEISQPINSSILALMPSGNYGNLGKSIIGFSYPTEREAIFSMPSASGSAVNSQQFVYSTRQGGFTRWDLAMRFGLINPNTNLMVWAPENSNTLRIENKTLTDADFFDGLITLLVSSTSGSVIVATTSASGVAAGDLVDNGAQSFFVVSVSGSSITVNGTPVGWTGGQSFTVYKKITTRVEFNKMADGTPADLKRIQSISYLFRNNSVPTVVAEMETEIQPSSMMVNLVTPAGDPVHQIQRLEPAPIQVSMCAQLSVGFSTAFARTSYEFLGVDVKQQKDSGVNYG